MKVKKTTQSLRKHAFSSFRERVDAVKIDPSRNLVKRVYDSTDTSHFLATLDHWKEVNISGNFTEFVDKVEIYSQSLPQVIYHQRSIYNALVEHIKVNDAFLIQPLLELLAQFVHDLGPDFMPYYIETLAVLTDIAQAVNPNELQNSRNPSNALEWTFNCMAFIFKYLSKTLSMDLIPTFNALIPILSLKTKRYIARYCAEALLFLVRKLKDLALEAFVSHSLRISGEGKVSCHLEDEGYCQSMVIVFSESMKSTKGAFHAKATTIFLVLLSNVALETTNTAKLVSIVCDIILNVMNHGSLEACTRFYQILTDKMRIFVNQEQGNSLDITSLMCISQILISLTFSESGKKITNWGPILDLVEDLLRLADEKPHVSQTLGLSLVYLVAVVFRNSSVDELTKRHTKLIKSISTINHGQFFTVFSEVSRELCESRMKGFGLSKFEQLYINSIKSTQDLKQVSLFSLRRDSTSVIPKPIQNLLWKEIKADSTNKFDLFWKLQGLKNGNTSAEHFKFLISLLEQLIANEQLKSPLIQDIFAFALDLSITPHFNDKEKAQQAFNLVFTQESVFPSLMGSHLVLKTCISLLDFVDKKDLLGRKDVILRNLAQNLLSPNHEVRSLSIQMALKVYALVDEDVPPFLSDICTIESMPLQISTARDLTSRIRNLAITFSKLVKPSELEKSFMVGYMFGLLTNKFQPSWAGVYEALPLIVSNCQNQIWASGSRLLTLNYASQHPFSEELFTQFSSEDGMDVENEQSLEQWFPQDSRILGSFNHMDRNIFQKYASSDSILEQAELIHGTFVYEETLRNRILQAFSTIPLVAEFHSDVLVPIVLHQLDIEEEEDRAFWNLKDRNALVELFTKFKNLQKVYKSDELKAHLYKLLCNKQNSVQNMALRVLLNWKDKVLNKYKDNLLNLLDDTIYRDELSKFLVTGADSDIEDIDLPHLMPIVLRILFGRAQSSPKSNSQSGRKFAVLTVLPNLSYNYIIDFLLLGSQRIGYTSEVINTSTLELYIDDSISLNTVRRINGYVRLLSSVVDVLGSKFLEAISSTVEPLIYSLAVAQKIINNSESYENSETIEKAARNTRQAGMRCLNELFTVLGPNFEWSKYSSLIYSYIIQPRITNFESENLQQPSALLKVITSWINFPNVIPLLYVDSHSQVIAVLGLLGNRNCKDDVILNVLTFAHKALLLEGVNDEGYYALIAHVVDSLLASIPDILDRSSHRDVNAIALEILSVLLSKDYIDDNSTRAALVQSLTRAMDKSTVTIASKINLLKSLSSLIDDYDCSWTDIEALYDVCCKSLRIYSDKSVRVTLVGVFKSFSNRFEEVAIIGDLLDDLNSYSGKRMNEPDFERRLNGFRRINEELYSTMTITEWLPIVYCSFFFINDVEELVMRTNATYTLNKFTDAFSSIETVEESKAFIHILKNVVLPHLCIGLRKTEEVVQTEYISVLEYLVANLKNYDDLDDMKVLLFGNDEEANFFKNINHIQLHRRQRAIIRLRDYRASLTENSIAHYILPIIEHYAFPTDEKLRNIANETVETISSLVRCMNWKQYRALFRRYVSNLKKSKPELLRENVSLIVVISDSLLQSSRAHDDESTDVMKGIPIGTEELNLFILLEVVPPLSKILGVRNDETITSRIRLSEALTNYVSVLPEDQVETQLAGILTSTCQVMRSRSEELRDAVRKSLARMAITLGAKYFKFILQELKTALSRGSQIHVLSFTVHSLIVAMLTHLKAGDLDEAVLLVVNVIMEDIFGAAGQEKDADGYTSKMKEVKHNKSYDTGELLSSNISLSSFTSLVSPIKMLLQENVSLKIQNKLDELIRRYSLGLNHNEKSSSKEILFLCYELHNQAVDLAKNDHTEEVVKDKSKEGHFLVKLSAKPLKTQVEYGTYISTLQKFAFDLLRTAITRYDDLLSIANLTGFIPLLENGLRSENEGVVISSLKVLTLAVRLPFEGEVQETLKKCSRTALNIIKDCPLTNTDLCQACLRFIATVIRNKPEIQLKETAISYLLVRIQPDLEEPNRQGLAFAFVKSILSQGIVVADLYDIMDKISNIMITNHTKEIRDMSRSAYFQFLMEYDQGKGRLEKQFKHLLNNLSYDTQDGRQSVLELLHLIIQKSGSELLTRLASSFFLGLANVAISDDSPKCREMATALLSNLFGKLGASKLDLVETYCSKWLAQNTNPLLQRCGLNVYKIYCSEIGFGISKNLDDLAYKCISSTLNAAKNDEDSDSEWESVYMALSVFSTVSGCIKNAIFTSQYESIWLAIVDTLLYPHSWVRLSACRLTGLLLGHLGDLKFKLSGFQIQTIAYRLLRQLSAPSISEALGTQIVKNLAMIASKWNKESTKYESKSDDKDDSKGSQYNYALDYLIDRVGFIMRQEINYNESFVSKKSSIQMAAMVAQIISKEDLVAAAQKILLGLYSFNDLDPNNSERENEIVNLSRECSDIIENKLGVTEFTLIYAKVKQTVDARRRDRKTKRALLKVNAPDVAAKRNMKKHERTREKRRHEKDSNGYYKTKRNRFN